jgi:hypothetical protein
VAQFGVVFLLFALGLEFSMTKVRFCSLAFFIFSLVVKLLFKLYFCVIVAPSCSSSCCSGGPASNFPIYVPVWYYSLGMPASSDRTFMEVFPFLLVKTTCI